MKRITIFFISTLCFYSTLGELDSSDRLKREDETEIASSVGIAFSVPEDEITISKSEESEFERMAIVQNLNYLVSSFYQYDCMGIHILIFRTIFLGV